MRFSRRRIVRARPTPEGKRGAHLGNGAGVVRGALCQIHGIAHVWHTGPEKADIPVLFGAKERTWDAASRNRMVADKFELLLIQLAGDYWDCGKTIVVHFDIASSRSRGQDPLVSSVGVEEGGEKMR